MSLFSGFDVTPDEINLLAQASSAAYSGSTVPTGWIIVTPNQLGLPSQYWEDGIYYDNDGANAIVLRQGDTWIISFRSADDPNDFAQLDSLDLFRPFLDAVVAAVPDTAKLYVTGLSLGGATTNQVAEVAATDYPRLAEAKFVAFAPLIISEAEGILNIGFENDPFYKWKSDYADFNSALDNLVAANAAYMSGNYDGQQPWDFSAHWVFNAAWMQDSIFAHLMTPDSVIFICGFDGEIQDITPGREDVGVFYVGGASAETIIGRNGNDYFEGFGGSDKIFGGAGDDYLSGGLNDDVLDGQTGHDVAYFSGLASQYIVERLSFSQYSVTGPDGSDLVVRVEDLQFADATVSLASNLDLEGAGLATYLAMNGSPPSEAILANLISFAVLQHEYGLRVGVVDPALYAWQALGQALAEDSLSFDNLAALPADEAFVAAAYQAAFEFAPSQQQVDHFVDQLDYTQSLYEGVYGEMATVELLARGAVYGQMLGISAELGFLA